MRCACSVVVVCVRTSEHLNTVAAVLCWCRGCAGFKKVAKTFKSVGVVMRNAKRGIYQLGEGLDPGGGPVFGYMAAAVQKAHRQSCSGMHGLLAEPARPQVRPPALP